MMSMPKEEAATIPHIANEMADFFCGTVIHLDLKCVVGGRGVEEKQEGNQSKGDGG